MEGRHLNRSLLSWTSKASVLRAPAHLRSGSWSWKGSRESRMESKMPENEMIGRSKARKGPSTPACEFVGEEIESIRRGVEGSSSTSRAITMGTPRRYRYASSILLAVALFSPVVFSGCAVRASYRVYDPGHADYHVWDDNEVVYYQRWEVETHHDHREFKKRHSDEQKEYWTWRHDHHDDKR